tara:strand:- start:79 stop:513 length:435 start_codon:yes stop_codon:yes gene_type:complete
MSHTVITDYIDIGHGEKVTLPPHCKPIFGEIRQTTGATGLYGILYEVPPGPDNYLYYSVVFDNASHAATGLIDPSGVHIPNSWEIALGMNLTYNAATVNPIWDKVKSSPFTFDTFQFYVYDSNKDNPVDSSDTFVRIFFSRSKK